MRKIEVVAAGLVRDGRGIATQRGYGEVKDKWEVPGGEGEGGGGKEEALRREIREELDAEIAVGKLLCSVEYVDPAFLLTMHCYLCSVVSGTLVLKEHESARWLSADGLESVDWLPADIQVIPIIRKCL